MSIDCIKRFWLACALAVLGAGAAAQEPTDMERLRSQVATIRDRAALTHFVADESEFNPLAKLSSGARARALSRDLLNGSPAAAPIWRCYAAAWRSRNSSA